MGGGEEYFLLWNSKRQIQWSKVWAGDDNGNEIRSAITSRVCSGCARVECRPFQTSPLTGGRLSTHRACFSKMLIIIRISESDEWRMEEEMEVIKPIKDLQYRSFSFGDGACLPVGRDEALETRGLTVPVWPGKASPNLPIAIGTKGEEQSTALAFRKFLFDS